jgi:hypothetical protein
VKPRRKEGGECRVERTYRYTCKLLVSGNLGETRLGGYGKTYAVVVLEGGGDEGGD